MAKNRKSPPAQGPGKRARRRETPPIPFPSRATSGRLWAGLAVVAVMAIAAVLIVARGSGSPEGPPSGGAGAPVALPTPSVTFSPEPVTATDFVGSEACASCHRAAFDAWSGSTHAAAGGPPTADRIISRFDGSPIRFRDAVVVPEQRGSTWRFVIKRDGAADRILRVDGVVGGGHMEGGGTQGFVTRMDDGTVRFLPFDFIKQEGTWFCNTAGRANRGWVPITADLRLADCSDWPPMRVLGDELRFTNCQSCHGSQIEVTADTAARTYRTRYTSLGINCESCHGPGRRHLDLVGNPAAVASGEIGMRPLATLSKDQSLGTCWQCHALKDQLRPGYRSGQPLDAYYSLGLPQLGDAPHAPDGRVRTFAYQQGHLYSDCYVNGGMTCTSCHDPHSQQYRDVTGRPLEGRVDDRQCTGCHASKAVQPEAHTRHARGSPGSRCVACHMPYLQEPEIGTALRYARSDHAIPVPRPLADSSLGVQSACHGCHKDWSETALDQRVRGWYGEIKPVAAAVASVMGGRGETDVSKAAQRLLLPGSPHAAAVRDGLARFVDQHVRLDAPVLPAAAVRLRALARHRDLDIRSLALAALHLSLGEEPATRTFLAAELGRQGANEPLVRSRWAVSIGWFADRQRESGDPVAAVNAYTRAIEVDPGNARLHLNLGLALAAAGRLAEAAAAYRASLAVDPVQPLTHVNLGIALAGGGDSAGARSAYQRALAINAREPLAHFNMGNLQLEAGNLDSASTSYQRAIAADASLSLAHFYLARILAQRGDLRGALREIDAGLEFDPSNAEARSARAQVSRMLSAR